MSSLSSQKAGKTAEISISTASNIKFKIQHQNKPINKKAQVNVLSGAKHSSEPTVGTATKTNRWIIKQIDPEFFLEAQVILLWTHSGKTQLPGEGGSPAGKDGSAEELRASSQLSWRAPCNPYSCWDLAV